MLEKLKLRVECYDTWCENVSDALDKTKDKSLTLAELKALLNTAFEKKFPNTDLLNVRFEFNFYKSLSCFIRWRG